MFVSISKHSTLKVDSKNARQTFMFTRVCVCVCVGTVSWVSLSCVRCSAQNGPIRPPSILSSLFFFTVCLSGCLTVLFVCSYFVVRLQLALSGLCSIYLIKTQFIAALTIFLLRTFVVLVLILVVVVVVVVAVAVIVVLFVSTFFLFFPHWLWCSLLFVFFCFLCVFMCVYLLFPFHIGFLY